MKLKGIVKDPHRASFIIIVAQLKTMNSNVYTEHVFVVHAVFDQKIVKVQMVDKRPLLVKVYPPIEQAPPL